MKIENLKSRGLIGGLRLVKNMGVTTNLSQHRITTDHALTILKSMSGTARHWKAADSRSGRDYLSIQPVTNMEEVEITFYTWSVGMFDSPINQEQLDAVVAAFKSSRKWKLTTC